MPEIIQSFDESLALFFQSVHNPVTDLLMIIVTHSAFAPILLCLVLLCFKKTRKAGVMVSIAMLISLLFNNVIFKLIFERERPFDLLESIELIIDPPSGYSFPSSHSGTAASAATAVCYCFGKTNKAAAFFAVLWALLVAFSRLYLCVHFLTDVIAGLIFGTVLGIVSCLTVNAVYEHLRKNKLR